MTTAAAETTASGSCQARDMTQILYREYGTGLLAQLASGIGGDHHAAEDIFQETMLRAWQHASEIDSHRGSVRGWLRRVGQNLVINAYRARQARPVEVFTDVGDSSAISDHAEGVTTRLMIRDALRQLRPAHREVLLEVYYRGLDLQTVADSLKIPIGTVKSRLHTALSNLRRLLGGDAT